MSTPQFTPWSTTVNHVAWCHKCDEILAEVAAADAVNTDDDDEAEFQVDLANLYALRGLIFTDHKLGAIANSSAHVDRQTVDATWINPWRLLATWPLDMARILLADWKDSRNG